MDELSAAHAVRDADEGGFHARSERVEHEE
jgi:hypothetical protein